MNDETKSLPDGPEGPPSEGASAGQKPVFRRRRRFYSGSGKKLGSGPFPGTAQRSFSGPSGPAGPRPAALATDGVDGPDDAPHVVQEREGSRNNSGSRGRRWTPRPQNQQNAGGQNNGQQNNQNNRNRSNFQNNQRNNQQRNNQSGNPRNNQNNNHRSQNNQSRNNGAQPGNQQGAGFRQNFRQQRQGRQRQAPAFVGPMDHSYRNGNEANGNYEPNFNVQRTPAGRAPRDASGEVNFNIAPLQPIMVPSAAPMMENTTPRIYCFVDDLFFVAKIQETAKKLGIKVLFTDDADEVIDRFKESVPENLRPTLAIFDLNHATLKPLAVVAKLKKKLGKEISILGFLNHLQGELKLDAQEAGCDAVMPRSAFSTNLPQILRKHGLPEEMDQEEN